MLFFILNLYIILIFYVKNRNLKFKINYNLLFLKKIIILIILYFIIFKYFNNNI